MSADFVGQHCPNLQLELNTAQHLARVFDTPRALTVWLLIEYMEFEQLVDLSIDANDYTNPKAFADDYAITKILSKSALLPLKVDKEQVAIDSFFESESRCKATNRRILSPASTPLLLEVKKQVSRLLGPLGRKELDFVSSNFRFGPGATTGVRGSGSTLSEKYDGNIHLTRNLYPFYRTILGDTWWEHQRQPEIVSGNRFTTVPKTAKTDRGICIEPTLNVYVQLGIGKLIRKRLQRRGVDLDTQERNQELARRAYSENLATIDLSQASDSISLECVRYLLPPEWFHLLNLCRSSSTTLGDKVIQLEKFSSMGNGYTFELESLIFAAITFACVPVEERDQTAIYGDDIILPAVYSRPLIETLNFLGLKVNDKKSFLAGSFFESCGADWFQGQNVRPFFLRKNRDNKIPYPMQIANSLRLYALRRGKYFCDSRYRKLWLELFLQTSSFYRRLKVPTQAGDTGFIVSRQESRSSRPAGGLEGWIVLTVNVQPIRRSSSSVGFFLSRLAVCGTPWILPSRGREPVRGRLGKPQAKKVLVSYWDSGLEWV